MHLKILVDQDIQSGQRLIDALDQRLPITAAFWLNSEESERWRLVIVSPLVSEGKAVEAYRLVDETLTANHIPLPLEAISILDRVDTRYKDVRRASQGGQSGITLAHRFG